MHALKIHAQVVSGTPQITLAPKTHCKSSKKYWSLSGEDIVSIWSYTARLTLSVKKPVPIIRNENKNKLVEDNGISHISSPNESARARGRIH